MEALLRSTAGAPPLHAAKLSRLAFSNRIFAAVYASALLALLYHHSVTLAHLLHTSTTATTTTTTMSSLFISLSLLIADLILAFTWATLQSFRMRPIYRTEFPDNLIQVVKESDFPAMDVFICTADPFKEPPVGVLNTALSVMAYDYPAEKISVYVSDDGGSELTLFAFMEAAKFAAHWLPYCRKNRVVDRSPEVYFAAKNYRCSETEKIKYGQMIVIIKGKREHTNIEQLKCTRMSN
ncbi:hypothetical protein TIFTF001_003275 [Ficus carica]|uniref:Cellulose synthase-like protein G3 n=1 Tax=Ficus carica TaxID=3494 RepID=A0AA88CVK3_FICCA|nr:hypothetical protein TIFTF001_003275 [Ficus carica]